MDRRSSAREQSQGPYGGLSAVKGCGGGPGRPRIERVMNIRALLRRGEYHVPAALLADAILGRLNGNRLRAAVVRLAASSVVSSAANPTASPAHAKRRQLMV